MSPVSVEEMLAMPDAEFAKLDLPELIRWIRTRAMHSQCETDEEPQLSELKLWERAEDALAKCHAGTYPPRDQLVRQEDK